MQDLIFLLVFAETMGRHFITNPMIHSANKTSNLHNCIIFLTEENIKCIKLLTSTLKLEAEISFEALVTTDKISRCQCEIIRNSKCNYVLHDMFHV